MRSIVILFAALVFGGPVAAEEPLTFSATPVTGVVFDVEGVPPVLWLKINGVVGQYKFEKLTDTPQPPPDPPDPPETDLTAFVETLTAEVEADDHDTVADVFRGIADRIKRDELSGYTAVSKATADTLLGVENSAGERTKRPAWKVWFTALMLRIFEDDTKVKNSQLEAAWREIGKAVEP